MRTVIHMLLMVLVAVVAIGSLFLIFGSTTCDSLANQTAYDLKWAIDEVAKDQSNGGIPFYLGDGIPESPVYYRLAPIRLCQQHGEYSYLKSFMGGEPEYKIYYEKFPEGFFQQGAWLWAENYPWHGSAMSSFVFWGAMRGLKVGVFALKKVTVAYGLFKSVKLAYSAKGITDKVRARDFLTALGSSKAFAEKVDFTEFLTSDSDFGKLIEGLSKQDAKSILDGLKEAGFLKTGPTGEIFMVNNKLLLNSEEVPVYILERVEAGDGKWDIVKKGIAFKEDLSQPAGLDFTDYRILPNPDTAPLTEVVDGKNYVKQLVRPDQAMQDLIQELRTTDPEASKLLQELYSFAATGDEVTDYIKPTLIQRIHSATVGKWKRFAESLKRKLYNIKGTVMGPDYSAGTKDALSEVIAEAMADPDSKNQLNELIKIIEDGRIDVWQRIKDKMKIVLGLRTLEEIKIEHVRDFIIEINKNGYVDILPQNDELNIWVTMIKEIWPHGTNAPISKTADNINKVIDAIKKVPKWDEYFKDIPYLSTDINIEGLVGRIIDIAEKESLNEEVFVKNAFKEFFEDTFYTRLGSTDEKVKKYALQELQAVIGILAGDMDSAPITSPRGMFAKYGVKELKKIVTIDGRAFAAPNSWIAQGLMGEFYEGCGDAGNNICVYSHGTKMENPIFLSEDAKKFAGNIKVWRPVEVWKQYLGWQAALKHIPPHPRFYVVSPCFAMAKVWKTRYEGQDTIFVAPEKLNLNESASNYCYADTNLINAYTTIWFTSDVLTVIETVVTWGISSGKFGTQAAKLSAEAAGKTAAQQFAQVWKMADPVTFGQVLAEAYISWPGYPFKSLDFQIMQSQANATVVEIIQKP